jgi:hypothetical protein
LVALKLGIILILPDTSTIQLTFINYVYKFNRINMDAILSGKPIISLKSTQLFSLRGVRTIKKL